MAKFPEVAAIGQPHDVSGEVVKAYVVKRDPSLTKDEVIAHCRQHMTGYKIPKLVEFKEWVTQNKRWKNTKTWWLREENDAKLDKVS